MSTPSVGVVDRHVFASNASAYDAAWSTVASTPALRGPRAGSIEERIPWGAGLELDRNAPVLIDESGELSPLSQLPLAYLPMDGRVGLSVTGLIRGPAGGVRVGTHTLLMDRVVFEAIAGFPLGLFAPGTSGVEPARWFPDFRRSPVGQGVGLEPLTVPAGSPRGVFEAARLSAVSSLAGWVAGRLGEGAAVNLLASVFDALSRAARDDDLVVLDPGDEPVGDRASWLRNVILLGWLSLPLSDRYETYFSSDGTGIPYARPLLIGSESGREALPPGRGRCRVSPGMPAAPRFVEWARCVFAGASVFGRVSKRVDVRGESLLSDRMPVMVPRPFPTTPKALVALVGEELDGSGRSGALGMWVARFLGQASPEAQATALRGLSQIPDLLDSPRFADGVVRGITTGPADLLRTGEGARFAIAVGTRSVRRAPGIDLAVRGLVTLMEAGDGFNELKAVVEGAHRVDGPVAGAELWRLGLGLLRRHGRPQMLPPYVALLGRLSGIPVAVGVAEDLADAMGHESGPDAGLDSGDRDEWLGALAVLWQALADQGADPARPDLHRLAWEERQRFGRTALASLSPSPSSRRFVSAFLNRDPALPVFLELRRSPVGRASRSEVSS